jgi:diguanylate cyclase (GGDEF)-like protein/PAS domain S-box-containing protein
VATPSSPTASRRGLRAVEAPNAAPARVDAVSTEALRHALLDAAIDAVVVASEAGHIVEWNPAAAEIFGITRNDALGMPFELIIPERLRAAYREAFDRNVASGATDRLGRWIEFWGQRGDGTEFPVEVAITRIEADPVLFVSHLRDITERRERDHELAEASRSLEAAERRHRTLLENLPSITYRAGLGYAGGWEYISPQVEDVLGYTPEEWMADPDVWERAMHPDDLTRVIAEEDRCAAEGIGLDIEYRLHHRNGDVVWVRDRASVGELVENGKQVVEGLLWDITDRKSAEEQLRHLVDHDDLTGLYNRRGFEREMTARMDAGELSHGGAIAILDLDHLKRINDSLGHAAGDRVITEIASMLRNRLRDSDLFSRLSGDEFGLLMPGIDADTARQRVLGLLDLVRRREGSSAITASAGIAMVAEVDGVQAADLLIAADTALYEAKNGGRDRLAVFTGENRDTLQWVSRVRSAIENEELVLFSQPIVDLKTGDVFAEELLVRMLGEDGEPIPAGQFIPIAESFGLIRQLDRWVVSQALELAAGGRRVSVNLSAASINDRRLVHMIESEMRATDFDPDLLIFEITETVATPAIESLRDFATRAERLGCNLALDDVGTGFGSLTYLRHLPFRYLKIDAEFVRGLTESAADARIVRSLVAIASGFGMRTVAEGVENEQLLSRLGDFGIDYAQGYHLGRPGPIDD